MAEARGSSPLSSTSTEAVTVGVNAFRDGLGVWLDRVAAGEEVILTRHGRPKIRMLPRLEAADQPETSVRCLSSVGCCARIAARSATRARSHAVSTSAGTGRLRW
jgi:prevent-host-death family protein